MSKVIWHATMSVDGFIAGPKHAMEMVIHLAPLLFSDRIRLFGQPVAHPIQLQPRDFSQAGPVANLHCRVPSAA